MNDKVSEIASKLPPPIKAAGSYVLVRQEGNLVYTAGIIPLVDGKLAAAGKLGAEVSVAVGQECARICALNALSLVREYLGGDIGRIEGVFALRAIVASTPEFTEHAKVANGASDILVELFGDDGKHVRAALGASSLPLDAPVEIEFVFRVV